MSAADVISHPSSAIALSLSRSLRLLDSPAPSPSPNPSFRYLFCRLDPHSPPNLSTLIHSISTGNKCQVLLHHQPSICLLGHQHCSRPRHPLHHALDPTLCPLHYLLSTLQPFEIVSQGPQPKHASPTIGASLNSKHWGGYKTTISLVFDRVHEQAKMGVVQLKCGRQKRAASNC